MGRCTEVVAVEAHRRRVDIREQLKGRLDKNQKRCVERGLIQPEFGIHSETGTSIYDIQI